MSKRKPRILFYDLETTPNLGFTWGKYEQNVLSFVEESRILCAAWKWLGQKQTHFIKGQANDKRVVNKLWELYDKADVVVAQNGDNFDQKRVRARFLYYDMKPPTPFASVDTLKVARRYFKFNSNKLDALGEHLGLGRKVKHPGIELWLGCMSGDPKSWKLMEKYNKQDVLLLERVYKRVLPWIENHPSIALMSGGEKGDCPNCGSTDVVKWGVRYRQKTAAQGWKCGDCGRRFIHGVVK